MNHDRKIALSRMLAIVIVLCIVLGAIIATIALQHGGKQTVSCDTTLSSQIGLYNSQICFRPLNVVTSNTSQTYVPVLTMKAGTNATISILYHDNIKSTTAVPQLPNLTSSSPIYAIALDTGSINTTKVSFSHGEQIYQNETWSIYNYTVDASPSGAGYYVILPPNYYGFYPALVVEANNAALNKSALAMWGYTGTLYSAEFILPSTIIATTNMRVANVTVPPISYCPNDACTLITHSVF